MAAKIKILGKVPNQIYLAVSGGPDSMGVLDFLLNGKKNITVLHFNHGTPHGMEAEDFVNNYCQKRNIPIYIGNISDFNLTRTGESDEEYWRKARYNFFDQFNDQAVVLAHQLNDQVENWIFTSFRGNSKIMPYQRDHYLRPFMLTRSETLLDWCNRKQVPYLIDPGNFSDRHARSFIRNNLLPQALKVAPGLFKTIEKKVLEQYQNRRD